MKASAIFSNSRGSGLPARNAAKGCVAAVLAVLISITWNLAMGQAQPPDQNVAGAQVLTRGPVHEAFAGMVTFNPEPGVVVTKAPPDVIEEMPPEERLAGDNVAWIPGYWGWDDERSDFLWVSGTWRALPPGRQWMAGYWGQTPQGYQWTSGYWADATAKETIYLPPPPATVEVGPNIAAPSMDYGWSPGCWFWYQGRYAWRPGYWALGRADWDWMPAHYVWTPRGYIFVGGYWDYPVARRGVLFAPIYFEAGAYSRRGYFYSPTIVIDLGVFSDHLFLRPRYHHYYFGDYYAASYYQGGFYASFSFQSGRHGYDPIYSHQRWEHRQDREWEHRVETSYQYRRDHEAARPPRTWVAQRNINPDTAESRQNRVMVATPISQLAKRKDSPMRFQPVAKAERQQIAQRGQEVQKSREQRRTLEAKAVDTTTRKPGAAFEPAKVKLPKSPIVARSANQLGKNQAPPKVQQSPRPDPKFQPKSEPAGRQPAVDRSNPQAQPRKVESEKQPTSGRSEAAPREKQVQPEAQPRVKQSGAKAQEQLQRSAQDADKATQLESQQLAKEATAKAQKESQRNAQALEQKAQPESERRANDAVARTPEVSQRNARGSETKAPPEAQPRAKDPALKAQAASLPNARGSGQPAQRMSEQRGKARAYPGEKGATQLLRDDPQKQGKEKSSSSEKQSGP
ncbi:MAG: hypothetical protein MUF81_15135 [Verrucomicrobia bacterium]|jgi:hypothetical protein|nr:hypothetical protein [Verrucomicrobiota bacterium]